MQSFQRILALLAIAFVPTLFIGCGGPGAPISGSADPTAEAADAALAPEGAVEASEGDATSEASSESADEASSESAGEAAEAEPEATEGAEEKPAE